MGGGEGTRSVLLGTAFKSRPSGEITGVPRLVVPAPLGAVRASAHPAMHVPAVCGAGPR